MLDETKKINSVSILIYLVLIFMFSTVGVVFWQISTYISNKNKSKQKKPSVSINRSISSAINYIPPSDTTGSTNIIKRNPPAYALRDYYILASYNTCITGSYDNGAASIQALRDALALGFRFLDFEIYSEEGTDNPIVSCSIITTSLGVNPIQTESPLQFSEVMEHLTTYAFVDYGCMNFTDPVIINLRIKTDNANIPTKLANIFNKYNQFILGPKYSFNKNNTNFGETLLPNLINKISIFVESINDHYTQNRQFMEYVNMCNNLDYLSVKTWDDFNMQTLSTEDTINYNKQHMTIIIPDQAVSNLSNKLITGFQLVGCQIVCLIIPENDSYFKESMNFFNNRHAAFVLKPPKLRYISDTIPLPKPQLPQYSYKPREVTVPDSMNVEVQI